MNFSYEPGTWQAYAFATVLIVLGCSFAVKFWKAAFLGKTTYWAGFLPITLISPFLVHLPANKRSLIREKQALWVYIILAPAFFAASMLLIEAGFDIAGLPGTETINSVINGGNGLRPPAIVFDKRHFHFSFPLFVRSGTQAMEKINKFAVPLAEKDKLIQDKKN